MILEDEKAADRIFMTGEVCIFYNGKTEPDLSAVIDIPEVISVDKTFHVLVKIECDKVEFTLADAPEYLHAENLVCDKAGRGVLDLICDKAVNGIDFTLKHKNREIKYHIDLCVKRNEDQVTTGTGDIVYVNQNKRDFDNYLSWYFPNNIGNLMTIRPTYRWSGSRSSNGKLWREMAELLNKLEVKSVHMIDCRELPVAAPTPPFLIWILPMPLADKITNRTEHSCIGE